MKAFRLYTAVMLSLFFLISCSSVFTGSITGSLVDRALYDGGNANTGIADAEVYLYTDVESMEADLAAWQTDSAVMPDNPAEGEPAYFLKTITDAQGAYTFNGFIWNELFPDYGKTGDRKEVFMLFYHPEYGLTRTAYPVYVVSDVTNRIPLFKLEKILNTAEIAGTVLDSETGIPLANANVSIWIPESWAYNSDGSINLTETGFSWRDTPSYTSLTDNTGNWRQKIAYKMLPSSASNAGTVVLRVTYAANGYIAENASDSRITDGGWDRDANGSIDSDENDSYFQSGEITAGSYSELGEISLADEYNTAVVTGRVINSNTGSGEPNVSVRIYVADNWSYNSADPADIEDAATINWPENPDYTLTTNADGEYSQNISFERKPSEADNRKTTRVRLVFVKNSFKIDSTTDPVESATDNGLTDGGWDRDGNGSVDADEDDAFFDPPSVITADLDNDLGSIRIKQTRFSETLSGEVWNNAETALVNGAEVWLFFDPDDVTLETTEPVAGDEPNYITNSTAVANVVTSEMENGRFTFSGLEWTDTAYSGNQSMASYWIYLPTIPERSSGLYAGGAVKYYLTSGASNYISLVQ